jgi:hypothetical protein
MTASPTAESARDNGVFLLLLSSLVFLWSLAACFSLGTACGQAHRYRRLARKVACCRVPLALLLLRAIASTPHNDQAGKAKLAKPRCVPRNCHRGSELGPSCEKTYRLLPHRLFFLTQKFSNDAPPQLDHRKCRIELLGMLRGFDGAAQVHGHVASPHSTSRGTRPMCILRLGQFSSYF